MSWTQSFSCAALLCSISARDARAEWPRINPNLKARFYQPSLLTGKSVSKAAEGGIAESDQIAGTLYSAVTEELVARGVEVQPSPLESAKTDTERYAIADLQTRYDTVGAQMRKNPGWVEHGRITLDDRVARFARGVGVGRSCVPPRQRVEQGSIGSLSTTPYNAEVTFVDA